MHTQARQHCKGKVHTLSLPLGAIRFSTLTWPSDSLLVNSTDELPEFPGKYEAYSFTLVDADETPPRLLSVSALCVPPGVTSGYFLGSWRRTGWTRSLSREDSSRVVMGTPQIAISDNSSQSTCVCVLGASCAYILCSRREDLGVEGRNLRVIPSSSCPPSVYSFDRSVSEGRCGVKAL